MSQRRETRIAENESHFREINDRLESELRTLPEDGETVDFVCECGRPDCREPVSVTLAEYERVRQDPRMFIIVAGHEIDDVEDVVKERHRYFVVEKKGHSAAVAEELDPRA